MAEITSLTGMTGFERDQRQKRITNTANDMLHLQAAVRARQAIATLGAAREYGLDPEHAATAARLRTSTAVPGNLPLRDPGIVDELAAKIKAQQELQFLIERPRTAALLADYDMAVAVQDDVETIGGIESFANAMSRRADAVWDWLKLGGRAEMQLDLMEQARDAQLSLDELIQRRREELQAGGATGTNDEVRRRVDAQRAEMQQRLGEDAPEDAPAADDLSWAEEAIAGGSGLWRWLTTRSPLSKETLADAEEKIRAELSGTLREQAFEALERQELWATAQWRQKIEADIAAGDGTTAWGGMVNIFKVAKKNPGRFAQYMLEIAGESGLTIAAGVVVGAATKSPAAAAAVMGAGSFVTSEGLYFEELVQQYGHDLLTEAGRKEFLDDPQVLRDLRDKAKAYGIVVGLLDAASAGAASKVLVDNPVGDMVLQMIVQSTLGGGGELLGRLAAGEDIDWNEVILEAIAETVTAPFEVGGMAVSGGRSQLKRAAEQKQREKLFNILGGIVDASTLRKRDRVTLRNAIAEVTKNGPAENMHVDPQAMEELFQDGGTSIKDFFEAVPELDYNAFIEARDTGSLYVIPTSVYAASIAGTEIGAQLQEHLKMRPGDMSAAEARTFHEDLATAQRDLAANVERLDTVIGELEGPLAEEMERLTSEIVMATGFAPDIAAKQAAPLVAAARVGAQRAGMTVSDYLRRYTLPAVRNADTVGPAPARPLIDPDRVIDAIHTGGAEASTIPGLAAIMERLDESGVDPDAASREDVVGAIKSLKDEGVLDVDMPMEDRAAPASVDAVSPGEEYMQTASLRGGEEDLAQWGLDPKRKNLTRDVALLLQERQRKLYGKINRKQRGPKTIEKMASWMADEIEFELQAPDKSALGWYGPKFQAALDTLGRVWAPLIDEKAAAKSKAPGVSSVADARALATALFAVSSNGTKVVQNVDNALNILLELDAGNGIGQIKHARGVALNDNITTLIAMAEEMGGVGMQEHLTRETTMGEVNKDIRAAGGNPKGGYPAAMTVPYAARYLGPKLSAFYANLTGSEGYLTMDLWWTRTINRYRGDVLPTVSGMKNAVDSKGNPVGLHRFKVLINRPDLSDKQALNYATEYAQAYANKGYKNGTEAEKAANTLYKAAFVQLREQPEGSADRAFMIDVARAAQAEVFRRTGRVLTIADIQAVLWYYEKRLYADMGVRDSGDLSYEEAAAEIIQLHEWKAYQAEVAERNQGRLGFDDPIDFDPQEFFQPFETPHRKATIEDFDLKTLRRASDEERLAVFQRPGWYVVTAKRSELGDHTTPENVARVDALREQLVSMGRDFVEVDGVYMGEPDGISFLVIGDRAEGFRLGAEWGQESILTNEGLVFTDGSGADNVPFSGITYGHAAKYAEFYSAFRGGIAMDAFSLHLDFPAAPDVTVNDGDGSVHYGARVEDDGKMLLTHWSPLELDVIDPAKAGSGALPGPERKRPGPAKVFFGLHIGRKGGYQREHEMLGRHRHEVRLDPKELYPWNQDPDGLKEKLDRSLSSQRQVGQYEQLIKDAGYKGFFVIGGPLGDVAAVFDAVEVNDRMLDDTDAKALRSAAFNKWFLDSKVVNSDGSPMMVFHGTGAAFDAFRPFSHFGSSRAARQRLHHEENFSRARADSEARAGRLRAENIVPVYMSLQNPLDIGAEGLGGDTWQTNADMIHQIAAHLPLKQADALRKLNSVEPQYRIPAVDGVGNVYSDGGIILSFPTLDEEVAGGLHDDNPDALAVWEQALNDMGEIIESAGYDGIVYKNLIEDAGVMSYVALRPAQVKSPFNRGSWDFDEGDILFQSQMPGAADPRVFAQRNNGAIILPKDLTAPAMIKLFETANLSTMIHETGHFFLWQLQRQANDGLDFAVDEMGVITDWFMKNSAAIAAEAGVDKAQVEEYLTVGTTANGDVNRAVHRAMHEQFARGFEAYALEGKSPSNAMRTLFEDFAAWLLSWYKSIKNLNVDIDDDIRGVFDRLLATEDELIGAAEREEINDMIATTAKEMGLDEDSYRRLMVLSQEARDEGRQIARRELMATEHRIRSAEYQSRLAEIDAEERDKIIAKPVHRAIQWLAYGRWLGAETPEDLPLELRLDTEMLVDEFGADILDKLPRGRRPVYAKDTLLQADDVAGWFGFNSGAEMIDAMIKTPKLNDEVKAAVTTRAHQELGDVANDPDAVAVIVADAYHGEKRGQVIVAELRALNRIGGKAKMTTRAQARAIAEEMIWKMPVREATQSSRYLAAERSHAEQAARHLAAGDISAAFESKRRQLIQNAMYSESRKVADLVGKTERLAGRLKRKGTRENLAPEYLGAIDDVLETYDFRKISVAAEGRRQRLQAYIEMMKTAGREDELAIPDHVLQNTKRVPYKTMTSRRLQGVYDTLRNIEHTARRRQKLRLAQQERELQEVRDEIAAAFAENVIGKPINRVATKKDAIVSGMKGYFNLIRNADTILRRIDGWASRGTMVRHFKQDIDAAGVVAKEMRDDMTRTLDDVFSVYGKQERRRMAARKLWKGYDQALSKWDLISIALNTGNKDNLSRLTTRDSRGAFTQNEVDALLDNLDKRDWDFVQKVWDTLEEKYWPLIRERELRVTGVAPAKVAATPVQTKFGEYRGGYYPIAYDRRFSAKVGEDQNRDLMVSMMAGRFGKAQTKNGHTKERAGGGGGRTVQLGMQVLFGHVNNVIHDLAYGEAVNTTWKLLQDREVKGLFERHNMLEDHAALELWVQDVAAGPAAGTHVLATTARRLKSGFTLSKLAFNMSTVAIQITGLTQSMALIGSGYMAKGSIQYLTARDGRFALAQKIKERSTFMREREETFQRDAYDISRDVQLDPIGGVKSDIMKAVMQAGFFAMQKVQYYAVDVPTWLGAHQKGIDEGMTEADAATYADRMVARAQASGLYADRSAIERGTLGATARQNEFLRLFTTLGSYMFAKYNVAAEVIGRAGKGVRDPNTSSIGAVLKGATDLVLLFTIEAIMYNAVKMALPGMDDEDDDGWAEFLAKETALSVASVFPFIRDVSGAVQGYGGGGAYGGISETIGRMLSSSSDLAIGEATAADARSLNDAMGLMAPGYPSTAIWRLIDGAGVTGEEPSPLAMIMGR